MLERDLKFHQMSSVAVFAFYADFKCLTKYELILKKNKKNFNEKIFRMKKFACSSSITWCDLYFAPIIIKDFIYYI